MILTGDCLEKLKELADNSVDSVCTDPPYGLKFMGKKWDYDVPSVAMWTQVLRVLKPGGYLLSFGGTRTYHRMVVAIEDAGFEVRDQLQWIFGSGFPKSHNIGDGIGTALKPANEPIVLARKPLSESTVAKNVLKWGTGGLNIDASRIEANDFAPKERVGATKLMEERPWNRDQLSGERKTIVEGNILGRWPANLLLDEEAGQLLDEQSGQLQSRPNKNPRPVMETWFVDQKNPDLHRQQYETTKGGASRFFYCAKSSKSERNAGLEGMPEKDPPGSKRSKPAEGRSSALGAPRANHHPTVKPIKLMEYLIKLITPPGGTCLDPFMGSGSTGVAAVKNGFKFIGIEMDKSYVEIAEKRIANA